MTALMQVYTTKKDRVTLDKVIQTLESNGIQAFTIGVTISDQTQESMSIYVRAHEHELSEKLCYDIFFPEAEKLTGEFIGLEVRNPNGDFVGLNVFYNGLLHYQWRNELAPQQPETSI